jgi:hypothetical protein
MMDSIEKAKAALDEAKEYRAVEVAQAYAAIAQAEQLKRVADAVERWLSVQGVLPEFYEHIDRVRNAGDEGTWAVVDGLNQRID